MDCLTWGVVLLFLAAVFSVTKSSIKDSGDTRLDSGTYQTHFTQDTCAPSTPGCSTYGYCEHRDFGVAEWATLPQKPDFLYQYCDYFPPGYCVDQTPCDQQAEWWLDQNYSSASFRSDIRYTFEFFDDFDGSIVFYYCRATFKYPSRFNRGTGPQCPLMTTFSYDDAGNLTATTNNASP